MNCCAAVFYLLYNNSAFCTFFTSHNCRSHSVLHFPIMNKLEQWLHIWAVLSWVPSWGYMARVQRCHHSRAGQKWNTWSAGEVRSGVRSLVLVPPHCFWCQFRVCHWYPSTHSILEWKRMKIPELFEAPKLGMSASVGWHHDIFW